ncbi:MAG: TolC family protein [Desulfobulbaceae bacterium]|nr:TolC family protein [Desulfobulbaceae bacterium]
MIMQRQLLSALFFFVFFLFWQSPGQCLDSVPPPVPEMWTVEEAVRFALAHSPDSAITRQRIAAARAAVKEAGSAFFPRLDVAGSYTQTDNPMFSFGNILNQGAFTQDIDFNDPGRTDNLNMAATVNYRLYNGGRDEAGIKAARSVETASQYELEAVHSQLGYEVVKTFYTIIQAEENLQARISAAEAINTSLAVARSRYEAGDLLKADLLSLEVQQSQAEENLILARHALKLANRGFLNLLGLDNGPLNLNTGSGFYQPVPEDTTPADRPELKKIDAAIDAAEALVRQARGGYYPTADLFAGYHHDRGYELDGDGNSWVAGVKLNYTLFNGRLTEAEVARANAQLEEKKEQKRKTALAINFEVEQARLFLEETEQRLQVTEKMVEQARESAALSRVRFKEGVILSSELIDVENRLTDARIRNTVARASCRIAVAGLRRAVGLEQFENSGSSSAAPDAPVQPANIKIIEQP